MIRAFFKDSVIYAIPALLSRGISIFLVPIYTKILSPADYGSFDMLIAFSGVVSIIIGLEISQGVARFYAGAGSHDSKVSYASTALWFTVFCYLIFLIVACFFSRPLSVFIMGREGLVPIFRVGAIYICINAIFYLLQNQFRWELRGKDYAVASLLFTVSSSLGAVLLAYAMKLGLLGLLLGLVLGAVIGVLYGLWRLRKSFSLHLDNVHLREMLSFSVPLVPAGLAAVASIYIDRIMIRNLMTIDDVGLFGVGARLASVIGLLMVGFQGALTPLVYAHHRDPETPEQLAKIFRYFLALALLMCIGISMFAKDILKIMVSPNYYSAASVVVFLAPAVLLAQMYIFAPGIGIAKKTHLMIWIILGGIALSIALNFFLIPLLGVEGAGLSTLISSASVFIVCMCISQKYYFVPHRWVRMLVACFFSCFIIVSVLYLGVDGGLRWVVNFCAVFIALAVLVSCELIQIEDIKFIMVRLQKCFKRS